MELSLNQKETDNKDIQKLKKKLLKNFINGHSDSEDELIKNKRRMKKKKNFVHDFQKLEKLEKQQEYINSLPINKHYKDKNFSKFIYKFYY